MKKAGTPRSSVVVVAENQTHRLICRSEGMKYVPDSMKYVYGVSKRRPLEEWFLDELRFFQEKYPGAEIFTLGSSCVFGERFINYLTICEFDIESEKDFQNLKRALRDSDHAIRRKLHALWKWDLAARKGMHIIFMVGHLDLAYFLQHRKEFLGKAHNRYMSSFAREGTVIRSQDYKVLQDGTIVPFDERLLSPKDRAVFENYEKITFETVPLDRKRLAKKRK